MQNHYSDLIVIDGGMGRELERMGAPFRQPEWSALALYEAPDMVWKAHKSFIAAGSDYITTNTYAIVPFHLGAERYSKDGKSLINLAVRLANEARADKVGVKILGSVPPVCGSYEAHSFNPEVAKPIVHDFLDAFSTGGVDAILFETIGSVEEANCYIKCIAERNIAVPVWMSFCLEPGEGSLLNTPELVSGGSIVDAVDMAVRECHQLEAVLFNCCDIRLVDSALVEAKKATSESPTPIRLGAYPNAFCSPIYDGPANKTLRTIDDKITPAFIQSQARHWCKDGGATILGGCCGCSPDHIASLHSLKSHHQ